MGASDEAEAVNEICRRLDGIPLAIELAASRMAAMTAAEVRDRLDQRLRLLVGSRRALECHHTLRHAVAWSYHLLMPRPCWNAVRCSRAVSTSKVPARWPERMTSTSTPCSTCSMRASVQLLFVADWSSGRTRYSMLDDPPVRRGPTRRQRRGHRDSRRPLALLRRTRSRHPGPVGQPPPTGGLRLVHYRAGQSAHRVSVGRRPGRPGHRRHPRHVCGVLGVLVHNYEPIAWAEELIQPACAVDHPRLAFLYVMASACWMAGRIEEDVGYADAAQLVIGSGRHDEVPFGGEAALGTAYAFIGQPERWVEWCRTQLARGRDTHGIIRTYLVFALTLAGCGEEARAAADRPDRHRRSHPQPVCALVRAVRSRLRLPRRRSRRSAGRRASGPGDRPRQRQPLRRDTPGGRPVLPRGRDGDPLAALDYVTLAIGNFHDAGNTTGRTGLSILAALFDRLGRHEPAATIAGFAVSPLTAVAEFNTASPTCAMSSVRRPTNPAPARVRRWPPPRW